MKQISALLIAGLLICFNSFSQNVPADTSGKVVQWINSEKFRFERKDSVTEFQIMVGKVILKQNNTTFYCDSAIYNKTARQVEAFGNVHINDADSVHTYSQYLLYYVDSRIANLKKKVKLTDGKITLHTEELRYDANEKIGDYYHGGRVENGKTVLTSEEGTYYGEMKDVYFKRNVFLKDPAYTLKTDSLLYNTETEISTFITKTVITDTSGRTIQTREGNYDVKNKKANFGSRPIITDAKARTRIVANQIDRDDATGINTLRGNAVYIDSAQGVSILANFIEARSHDGTFFATQQPLMIIKQDADSLYIAADTLFSGRMSKLQQQLDSIAAVNARRDSLAVAEAAKLAKKITDSTELTAINNRKGTERDSLLVPSQLSALKDRGDAKLRNMLLDTARQAAPPVSDIKRLTDSTKQIIDSTARIPVDLAKVPTAPAKPVVAKPAPPKSPAGAPANNRGRNPVIIRDTTKTNDSADRFFMAYHHVRIFSDSLQAVSDSLFYSGKDSIFRLFTDPIVWSGDNQLTGDTIYMHTKNKKPERLFVWENALAVNKTGPDMYNQLKGNRLTGVFTDGNLDYMRSKGNAESIYYVKDEDSALVAINNVYGDIIDLRFVNKELDKVVVISEPKGSMIPVNQASEQERRLRNFKWRDARRPKTKFELFGN
ncbi:OstA family protein [Pseudoflavitalea sp. G-6-1-2]|uniref:OstA-like protein n=1 Tax=Pseudoflavitalea sp. G-6-1-2 TaxID=2728841 RepID=UPI00146A754A|nr:OstA-like protein [Pseudoflavitalea sp. G-6-1-2]NML23795.1 OstA family protein [Pseudoflavitalea sp. G-6-1-2]